MQYEPGSLADFANEARLARRAVRVDKLFSRIFKTATVSFGVIAAISYAEHDKPDIINGTIALGVAAVTAFIAADFTKNQQSEIESAEYYEWLSVRSSLEENE